MLLDRSHDKVRLLERCEGKSKLVAEVEKGIGGTISLVPRLLGGRGEGEKREPGAYCFAHAPNFPRFLGNRKLTSNLLLQMRLQMLARSARYAGWQPAAAVGNILTVCATVRDVTPDTKVVVKM